MLNIPVLETERLLMRSYQLSDYQVSSAMWNDPAVLRYIRDQPFTPEESWSRLFRHAGQWALLGYGMWAVIEKQTGAFCGEIGFMDLQRPLQPAVQLSPEIGWILCSHAHGKGYATEAVKAAISWFDAKFGPSRTACIIHPDNHASRHVAQKCGYCEEQTVRYHDKELLFLVRDPALTQ